MIMAFLTGICFDFGKGFLRISAMDAQMRASIVRSKIMVDIENPEGFEFSELMAELDNRTLTLTGMLSNVGQQDWADPDIRITVFAGELEIGKCEKAQHLFMKASEKMKFTVVCRDIRGSEIPEFIRYQPKVTNAWYERKP